MIKNACAVLLASRGTPMILAGDEFCNTQFGNNNPYCQDNEVSWLDWNLLKNNKEIFSFFKNMIKFRKIHPVLKDDTKPALCGFPSSSKHGNVPWCLLEETKVLGVMLAGRNSTDDKDDIIYIAINVYWEKQYMIIPDLPKGLEWRMAINTALPEGRDFIESIDEMPKVGTKIELEPRSVMILCSIEI
jgi:glycogen operon protein